MGTQYIFAQSCCNFSHIFRQDILKVLMIFFFDSFFFYALSFLVASLSQNLKIINLHQTGLQ